MDIEADECGIKTINRSTVIILCVPPSTFRVLTLQTQ